MIARIQAGHARGRAPASQAGKLQMVGAKFCMKVLLRWWLRSLEFQRLLIRPFKASIDDCGRDRGTAL
jgi:hypothetical protein